MFHVDKTVGTIIIAKPLDAEQQSFYNLTVQATDGTRTTFTQVPHSCPALLSENRLEISGKDKNIFFSPPPTVAGSRHRDGQQ